MLVTVGELQGCIDRLPLVENVNGPEVRIIVHKPIRTTVARPTEVPENTPAQAVRFKKGQFRDFYTRQWYEAWTLDLKD